jgi:3-oxoacyl-[acyl-carrier-protein] synthase II
MRSRPVVITGVGAISPLGRTVREMWEGLMAGRCGIRAITAFDPDGFACKIAGQVPEYKMRDYVPRTNRRACKLMSRVIELAVIAADQAVRCSGLVTKGIDPERVNIDPQRTAILMGVDSTGCDLAELAPAVAASVRNGRFCLQTFGHAGMKLITPLWLLKYLPNMPACHVGIIHDIRGPSNTITCGEASGILAISDARRIIERGDADLALAGGADTKVTPLGITRQCLQGRAATMYNDLPQSACRPFDAQAAGSVFGEAGALVVLESFEHAKQRHARIYAEVVGVGHSHCIDPTYKTLESDGAAVRIAMEMALADAKLKPQELDLIIPHGTGIADDDLAEARAIEATLGSAVRTTPVWPTKSLLSSTGGASGALDAVVCLSAMTHHTIPAAKNCENQAAGCHLCIAKKVNNTRIRYALCCSYTDGGQTAAIILKHSGIDTAD